MLTIREISSPDDQRVHLNQFNPSTCTWVVSDAKAKFDLQRQLINKNGFLDGLAVVRASELWRTLLTRLRPDLQLVSPHFATTMISEQLSKVEFEWAKTSGAADTACAYMTQLMPILAHEEGKERLDDWFKKNESAAKRWKHWADLCFELWKNFVGQGFISPAWVCGVLVNETDFEKVWKRNLIFDLGSEFNQVEADLLNTIKRRSDVTVLRPIPDWASEYKKTLYAYELLQADKVERTEKVKTERTTPLKSYQKFTTMIAEVKNATAVARQWLDSGVKPSEIAIVAPDIECYWPSLFPYLREEGINSAKDVVTRLHSFPDISQWMATLRLRSGSVAESDLEVSLYEQDSTPLLSYERFRVLYTAIYDREDLIREVKIASLYKMEHLPNASLYRDEFVAWALKAWPEKRGEKQDTARIEKLFKQFFADCSASVRLPISRWLSFLELLSASGEERIIPGDSEGLSCINLRSAENSPATHMIFLGLTEQALKASSKTAIIFGDTLSLAAQVGFHLNTPESHDKLEFEVRWMTENSHRYLHLYTPETDFDGTIQPPSWIWIQGRGETDVLKFSIPEKTRWDEIQSSGWEQIAKIRNWSPAHLKQLSQSIEQDLGQQPLPKYAVNWNLPLSPSTIENYLDCPFIFSAKKLFGLQDKASLDLDVDAATRGSIMHSLFKLLLEEPLKFDHTDEELAEIVNQARAGGELFDERLWPPLKVRYIQLAKRFLEFERDWRKKFPLAKTIAREHSFEGFIGQDGSLSKSEGKVQFRGRFDRIDQDNQGHYAVIDYKSSPNDLRQHGSWIKNNEVQLLLYSLALEEGIANLPAGEVVEAVYFVSRTMERETGLRISDREQNLYVIEGRAHNKATSEQKQKLYSQIRQMLGEMLTRMNDGDYAPRPIDKKICERCNWSLLCRAPHLN